MSDRFVGKVVKFEIDGVEYKLKSPPAKAIAKLLSLQNKDPKTYQEEDWSKVTEVLVDAVKRTYPEWSEEEIDEFVVQNMIILQEKLPLAMGWITEKELERLKKQSPQIKPQ